MLFIKKNKTRMPGRTISTVRLFSLVLWEDTKTEHFRRVKIFGVPVIKNKRRKKYAYSHKETVVEYSNNAAKLYKNTILWIDHSLKGGTEVYSLHEFNRLKNSNFIIRLQYDSTGNAYVLIVINENNRVFSVPTLKELESILFDIQIDEIVLNNMVSYNDVPGILNVIERVKNKKHCTVSFRGHDFYPICPSFTLIDCSDAFCNLNGPVPCEDCLPQNAFCSHLELLLHNKLSSDIHGWREVWSHFFEETLDEIIVFSHSSKELFVRAYPVLSNKIHVKPHEVAPLPKVHIEPHTGINIGTLGQLSFVKGVKVIQKMVANKPDFVNFVVIGKTTEDVPGAKVLGEFKREDLPKIVTKEKIDVIFIASIWPETFSYTTSEAMLMDVPVVCYNMGAPAERVKEYPKGLVLDTIDYEANLRDIIDFVYESRNV